MQKTIELTELTPAMVETCAQLYCTTYNSAPWHESWDSPAPIISFLEYHLANNYFLGYVIKLDNSIVGACIGFQKPWNQGVEYYIDEFFIHPDFQGQGLGSKLMQHAQDQCIKHNFNAIILNTERGFPAEKFYKRNDFTEHEGLIVMSKIVK
ncbi:MULTISPECIES: GNAT family N-acetyltransferase [Providencia]|uniref:GNAT family N-acetyltransferase n=1 Tax=Providencia TaxID=586 RepID=UPI00235F6046|nr:GNAT family N-acetyltransferase [Providencia rettgeri]